MVNGSWCVRGERDSIRFSQIDCLNFCFEITDSIRAGESIMRVVFDRVID